MRQSLPSKEDIGLQVENSLTIIYIYETFSESTIDKHQLWMQAVEFI